MGYLIERADYIPREDAQRDALAVSDEDAEEALEAIDALGGDYLPDEHLADDGFGDY